MNIKQSFIAAATALVCGSTWAAVTADEAKALGSTLTPLGAIKAGNKEGSIPAYSGGLTSAPAGFNKGDGICPDPFADEKPKFSISAASMAPYADKLTEGARELLKRNPSYRIDVYPTHRSVTFPKSVLDNTQKNALRAKTSKEGRVLEGAAGGYPFPIPKDGYEVMWNHLMRYVGVYVQSAAAFNQDGFGKAKEALNAIQADLQTLRKSREIAGDAAGIAIIDELLAAYPKYFELGKKMATVYTSEGGIDAAGALLNEFDKTGHSLEVKVAAYQQSQLAYHQRPDRAGQR